MEAFPQKQKYFNNKSMELTRCKRDSFNPWLVAADGSPVKMVQMLIGACKKETIDSVDSFKYNAIHFAVRTGSADVLQALPTAGIDPNGVGNDKCTALLIACINGNAQFVEKLLEAVTPQTLNHQASVKYQCKNALFAAVQNDRLGIVKMLLEKGANPYLQNDAGFYAQENAINYQPNSSTIYVLIGYLDKNSGNLIAFSSCRTGGIRAEIVKKSEHLNKVLINHNVTHDIAIPPNVPVSLLLAYKLAKFYPINRPILDKSTIIMKTALESENSKK